MTIQHARTHDYGHLVRRWRAVCRAQGLRLEPYFSASGFELFVAETRKPDPAKPWIYLSAGIHGDEPASTEGALEWILKNPDTAAAVNLLVFPCLNPWGLANNSRTDENGRDLNRTYHEDVVPQTAAHRALLAGRTFDLALMLHEDYDANGIYIYELRIRRDAWGEDLIQAAVPHVPIDTRRSIEGRGSKAGIVRRSIRPDTMPEHPEAFLLHFQCNARTFTIETPSEAHIDARVAAQAAVTERAVHRTIRERTDVSRIYKKRTPRIFSRP